MSITLMELIVLLRRAKVFKMMYQDSASPKIVRALQTSTN